MGRERKGPVAQAEWREFEALVARIEADADRHGVTVTSPDRIRCKVTGRLREVDASIYKDIGSSRLLVTLECRKRSTRQDVTWIEQLATKRLAIGADKTIAVSATGFSAEAKAAAAHYGIDLRTVTEFSIEAINQLIHLEFVWFTHRRAAVRGVGLSLFRPDQQTSIVTAKPDLWLAQDIDVLEPIFRNVDTGDTWSVNDIWRQLQQAADPFEGIVKGAAPVLRTAAFPYPGNVSVMTANGPVLLSAAFLTMALWLEVERVGLSEATRAEYEGGVGGPQQRVEFVSARSGDEPWRLSLQVPKLSGDLGEIKIGGNLPDE